MELFEELEKGLTSTFLVAGREREVEREKLDLIKRNAAGFSTEGEPAS